MTRTRHLMVGLMMTGLVGTGRPLAAVDAPTTSHVRSTSAEIVVKSIRWAGKPCPGATIEGHVVMRPELGSPAGGDVAFGDVQDNGTWS